MPDGQYRQRARQMSESARGPLFHDYTHISEKFETGGISLTCACAVGFGQDNFSQRPIGTTAFLADKLMISTYIFSSISCRLYDADAIT